MYCTACGDTNWADLRLCLSCGRDIHPERAAAEPPSAGVGQGEVGQGADPVLDVPAAGDAPRAVRRRRGVDDPDGTTCSANVVSTSDRMVVVEGSHGVDHNLLLAVDKTSGTVTWKRSLPAGADVSCVGDPSRIWCLANPMAPFDEYADGSTPSATDQSSRLATYAAADGTPVSVAQVGAGEHGLLGVSGGSAFVGTTAPPTSSDGPVADGPVTVLKYDGAGRRVWASQLASVTGGLTGGPVVSAGGIDYLVHTTTSDGEGLSFRDSDGAARRVSGGGIAMLFQGVPVARPNNGGTWVDGISVSADEDPVALGWQERSAAPRLTAAANGSGGSLRTSIRGDRPPYSVQRTVQGTPMAYCDGALIMVGDPDPDLNRVALRSVDPHSGGVRWSTAVPDPATFAACGAGEVMLGNAASADGAGERLTGYDLASGRRRWSVTLPPVSQLAAVDRHSIVLAQMGDQGGALQQITLIA